MSTMWANQLLRRTSKGVPLFTGQRSRLVGSLDVSSRDFSSDNNEGRGGGGRGRGDRGGRGYLGSGRGGGGRGGGGDGGRGGGGRGRGDWNRDREGNRGPPRKPNFAEKFSEPASRGDLQNHRSDIPRLAGRKPKGHGIRSADPTGRENGLDDGELGFGGEPDIEVVELKSTANGKISGSEDGNDTMSPAQYKKIQKYMRAMEKLRMPADADKYYWDENAYDLLITSQQRRLMEEYLVQAEAEEKQTDEDGNLVVEIDDDLFQYFQDAEYEEEVVPNQQDRNGGRGDRRGGGGNKDFSSKSEIQSPVPDIIEHVASTTDKPFPGLEYDAVAPLDIGGPEIEDFALAMLNHPTGFAQVQSDHPHPENRREPRPDIPKNRADPPLDFLETYSRFLFVTGLPPVTINGKQGDFENPVHRHEIQKIIADLFDVESQSVSPASLTSGFIGFGTEKERRFVLEVGPTSNVIESPVTMSAYEPGEEDVAISKDSPDSIVLVQNLPAGSSPSVLARTLFPSDTDVGKVCGKISANDIIMKTPNSALIRFESAEVMESALVSPLVEQKLVEFGQHRVRCSKARRGLVYTGKHGGADRTERLRELGPRLIVDGDMPTRNFFVSHADVVHLRFLDPSVTKEEIAAFFQPFCNVTRDVEGSVEFVTCHDGFRTDRAFVGFDELGELDACLASFNAGRIKGLGPSGVVIMKAVKDLVKLRTREKRQTRSEEELMDSLYNWEQYVDPADVEELIATGISKEALNEGLRNMRFNNPTFASLDQAMRGETLQPEMESGGMYAELVRLYIETLKDCIGTPENPGSIYEGLHFPGEEIDTSIFDTEKARLAALDKRRSAS